MTASLPAIVIQAAVDEYRLHGYAISYPAVDIVPANTEFEAETLPGHISVASDAALGLARLARVMARPTVKLRAAAYRSCGLECVYAAQVALHETAHLVQYQYGGITGSDGRIEGLADAVAFDIHRAFIRRIIGANPTGCWFVPRPDNPGEMRAASVKGCAWFWQPPITYVGDVATERRASMAATGMPWQSTAARTWRMQELAVAS